MVSPLLGSSSNNHTNTTTITGSTAMNKNVAKYIKNHVSTYGKDVKTATNKHFSVNDSLIVRAVKGDKKACTQIADMGILGERLSLAMPVIKEHTLNYIDGIKEYNTTLAAIYKAGGNASLAIDKAGNDLAVANLTYQNKRDEYEAQLKASLAAEGERHNDAMDVIELKAWVESQVREVEAFAMQDSISNTPYLKQLQADREHSKAEMLHWLEHGSNSNDKLIVEKNYLTNPVKKLWNEVRGLFT